MVKRYVLLKAGPNKSLAKLTKGYKDGVGIRAVASATEECDYTHFLAIEANTLAEAVAMSRLEPMSSSKPMSLMSCDSPPCKDALSTVFHVLVNPSFLPGFEFVVFLYIEFEVSIGERKPPNVRLKSEGRAGIITKDKKKVLLELGSENYESIESDIATLRTWRGVKKVSVFRTGAESMVRAYP